jgi:predicted ATPase
MQQNHAEQLLARLQGRPPAVIELMGTPNAGKTEALRELKHLLRGVAVVYETAAACPLPQKFSPAFNTWTACETIQRLLAHTARGAELIFCERGLFDALCWMQAYLDDGQLTQAQFSACLAMLEQSPLFAAQRFTAVFVCSPKAAIAREHTGQIVNEPVLEKYNRAVALMLGRRLLRRYEVLDTTLLKPGEVAAALREMILRELEKD